MVSPESKKVNCISPQRTCIICTSIGTLEYKGSYERARCGHSPIASTMSDPFTVPSTDAFGGEPLFVSSQGKLRSGTTQQQFPRISKPVELLRPSYDVVVIGSGYGGGVAASRMARGDLSVCVLERGQERWRKSAMCLLFSELSVRPSLAGQFPTGLIEATPHLYVHGKSTTDPEVGYMEIGDPTGLYRFNLGDGKTQDPVSPVSLTGDLQARMSSVVAVSWVADDAWQPFDTLNRSWRDESFECEHLLACRQEDS